MQNEVFLVFIQEE